MLGRQDWTTWSDADTARSTETTLLLGGRVLQRESTSDPYRELHGREAGEAAFAILSAAPPLAAAHIRTANGRGLSGGALSPFTSKYSWPDSLGRADWDLNSLDQPVSYNVLPP